MRLIRCWGFQQRERVQKTKKGNIRQKEPPGIMRKAAGAGRHSEIME